MKELLKAASVPPVQRQREYEVADYEKVVFKFAESPYSVVEVTDFKITPQGVKKGLDRAIAKSPFRMKVRVKNERVYVEKEK